MDQKISIKIADRTFNLTASTPEQEEVIRLAADAINQRLETFSRRNPGKSMLELLSVVALNEGVCRINIQREMAVQKAEAEQLGKDMANYLAQTGK